MNRWELEQKIVLKALKDPAFKKRLLSQPKETIAEIMKNEKMPGFDKITVRIVEEKQNEWVLSLPQISENTGRMTEGETDKLASGCRAGSCAGATTPVC